MGQTCSLLICYLSDSRQVQSHATFTKQEKFIELLSDQYLVVCISAGFLDMGGIVSVLHSGERLLRLNLVAKQTGNFMQNIMHNWKIFSALWTGFLVVVRRKQNQ